MKQAGCGEKNFNIQFKFTHLLIVLGVILLLCSILRGISSMVAGSL